MKKPTNTSKEAPHKILADMMTHKLTRGTPNGFIENMEARGQSEFVDSDVLPIRMRPTNCKEILVKYGFEFLGPIPDDDQFQYVKFPNGWIKEPTEHSMWSNLLDSRGRKRGSIFYKAAFYDRRAHIILTGRYSCNIDYEITVKPSDNKNHKIICNAVDIDGKILNSWESLTTEDGKYNTEDLLRAKADEWLSQNFPKWREVDAYWDD